VGVTTAKRVSAFPDLPTVAEAAKLPNYDVGAWFGLVAPAKLPDAVARKLAADVAEVSAMPDAKAQFATLGMELGPQTPSEFDAFLTGEVARWSKLLKQAGIEPQ
jgi:tripartite-type tricarboxylate transporter receptor subunit TctC